MAKSNDSVVVRIGVERTKELEDFVKKHIGLVDSKVLYIIVRKAVDFALSKEDEFKKFLKGEAK